VYDQVQVGNSNLPSSAFPLFLFSFSFHLVLVGSFHFGSGFGINTST
jgi:hypothetical protein